MAERTAIGPARTARTKDLLRRPTGLVDETRWLFLLCNLLAWFIVLSGPFSNLNPTTLTLAALACTGLLGSWLYLYLTKVAPIWLDIVYCLSVAGFALSCPSPTMAYSFGFTSLWFRAMYGSTYRIALYTAGTTAAMAASVLLWGAVPGHQPTTPANAVVGTLPVMFLVVAVFRYLALSLFAREQSQRRDATLAQLGAQLLGVTDQDQIYRHARAAVAAYCAATPDLHAFVGIWDAETASFQIRQPDSPLSDLAADPPGGASPDGRAAGPPITLPDSAELSEMTGIQGRWVTVPLPDQATRWMLLTSPRKISHDVIVAFTSLINQVALALRNSNAHHDLDLQANTDSLTGLLNRAAFTVAVERAVAQRPGRLALMFLDLDDFKIINDSLGHAAGDELLRHVATRMREAVRAGDLCARLGGDEFAVLLHDGGDGPFAGTATVIAQRLIDLISTPVALNGRTAQIGASVGIAHASGDTSPEALLQEADIAMYAAKAQGKNRFQAFRPGLLQSSEHVRSLAAFDLRLNHH